MSERIFRPFTRFAPQAVWSRLLLLALDVTVFNFVFYNVLRSVLLEPLGYSTALETAAWFTTLVAVLFVLHGLKPRQGRAHLAGFAAEIALFGAVCVFAAMAASSMTVDKGVDRSWLRVEVVKTPFWLMMFAKVSPGFTASVVGAVALLAWRTVASPRSLWVRIAPGVAVGALVAVLLGTFIPVKCNLGFFAVIFCVPLIAFWALLACGASGLAFRMFPFVLDAALIALAYTGFIPFTRLAPEFVCAAAPSGTPEPNRFGVTRLFPADDTAPDPTFKFLRRMVLSGERAFFSYGPTCGIYSVRRDTGAIERLPIPGLVREMGWSTDGRDLWALNWMKADFLAIEPETLRPICKVDMFHLGMKTPLAFAIDRPSGHVYMTNVTPPMVAELTVHMDADDCRVTVDRTLDFHAVGYTRFTDGAFSLHIDREHNRLYVIVAMLEGKYEVGLVEIELSTFTILRDIRLPAGTVLVPVHGRNTALLPSYYWDLIYEVSLADMQLVRTIAAAPTIFAIEQDEKRGLFYATSRTTGELLVIDDARGQVVRSFTVGAKPDALKLDAAADQLFLGSARGIFRIDLPRFWSALEETRPRQPPKAG